MYSVKMRSSRGGVHGHGGRHISGAEQIVSAENMDAAVLSMLHRARAHGRGQADFINLKVEEIQMRQVVYCPLLPVYQMNTRTKEEGRQRAREELLRIGVSDRAVTCAFQLLESLTDSMRGAAVIDAESGMRLDDLKERGVRCSSMDAEDAAHFASVMTSRGMGGDHPREALVLASKVAYAEGTVAELCWSDDPEYVTGYVGSRRFGYGRITVMKDLGDPVGGRVFFVEPGTDIKAYEDYLQNRPVLVRIDDEGI